MNKLTVLAFLGLLFFGCGEVPIPQVETHVELLPTPQSIISKEGYFDFSRKTKVEFGEGLQNEQTYFNSLMSNWFIDEPLQGDNGNSISFELIEVGQEKHDWYSIDCTVEKIVVKAREASGIAKAIQTFRQLLPEEAFTEKRLAWNIKLVEIEDYADFQHRGMLLDCCRHFFDREVVLKYIDLLALYKMNVLHWHLTEDQGWRIEIDAYTKLNTLASSRTELDGSLYSGLYSKSDMKVVVAYAAERGITVIPEIELPGHSQAAVSAYPYLSCTGQQVPVANDWGVFKEIYCAGNDSTFLFLERVLDEVMEIFPSEYIHIGGDEAPKTRWEQCDKCQKRIKDEHLHSEHELQSYFINRIEKYLNKRNRQLIGWDEILEGGLSPGATVQSWRGVEGGIQAARSEHAVIMSPTSHCYFDYDLKSTDMEEVFNFKPIPEDLEMEFHDYILGGECNMWTEHVPDEKKLDEMMFPRLLAMSQVLWNAPTDPETEYFPFETVTSQHAGVLEKMGVQPGLAKPPFDVSSTLQPAELNISTPIKNVDFYFAWENEAYQLVNNSTLTMPIDRTGSLKYKIERADGFRVEEEVLISHHQALGITPVLSEPYSHWYTAGGDNGLVDGLKGSSDFRDGRWQGFWGSDFEAIIELQQETQVQEVEASFYQYVNAWIFAPTQVQVFTSNDGVKWKLQQTAETTLDQKQRGKMIDKTVLEFETEIVKWVKLKAKNFGKVPDWHEAAGADAWVFIDEISVR